MSNDIMMAFGMLGAAALASINTYALFRDGAAKGIRPYSNMYYSINNMLLAWSFAKNDMPITASLMILHIAINLANATLIIRYQGLILFKKAD